MKPRPLPFHGDVSHPRGRNDSVRKVVPRGVVIRNGSTLLIKFNVKHHPFINAVKSIRGYRWDKTKFAWAVHIGQLRQVRMLAEIHGWTLSPQVAKLPDLAVDDVPLLVSVEGEQLVVDGPWREDVTKLLTEADAREDERTGRWFIPLEAAVDVVMDLRTMAAVRFIGEPHDLMSRIDAAAEMLALSRALDPSPDWELTPTFKRELRPHQHPGAEYAVRARRAFLWGTMGTGKTTVALAAIEHLAHLDDDVYPCLVVVPAGIITNWSREITACIPHRSFHVAAGMRARMPLLTPDLLIVSYPILGKHDDITTWGYQFTQGGFRSLIVDEGHRCANAKTIQTASVVSASIALPERDSPRLLLTGTPVRNRRVDIIPQLQVIARDGEFGDTKQIKADERLSRRLRTVCAWRPDPLEVLKRLGVVGPDGTAEPVTNKILVDGDPKHLAEYREAEENFLEYLRQKAREKALELGTDPYAAETRAAMIAGSAGQLMLVNTLCRLAGLAKIKPAKEWMTDFLSSGEKLLVFAHHRDVMAELSTATRTPIPQIHGDVKRRDRDFLVDAFQEEDHIAAADRIQALLLQIDAAGEGLTLTKAYQVLHAELKWVPGAHDQANARAAWRMNDPHNVIAHYLVCADTIDEVRWDVLDDKRAEMLAVTDGDRMAVAGQSMFGDVFARMLNKALGIKDGEA